MDRQATYTASSTKAFFDEEYLRALANSNPEAENSLIAHFCRPVQTKLRACLRSPEIAQDAAQETFLRVLVFFRSGRSLEHPNCLPRFVYTVCHNVALEFLRAHTRHDQWAEDAPEPVDPSLDPERRADAAERRQIVHSLLRELSERDRQLLCRVSLAEEDKDAICREFHVNREYLRVLLYRARRRFKALLEMKPKPGRTASASPAPHRRERLTERRLLAAAAV